MKKIKIDLIYISPPDAIKSALEESRNIEVTSTEKLIKMIIKWGFLHKHESLLEHIKFSFRVDYSSRLELQEHVRHRMSSCTVESTRYTLKKFKELKEYILGGG